MAMFGGKSASVSAAKETPASWVTRGLAKGYGMFGMTEQEAWRRAQQLSTALQTVTPLGVADVAWQDTQNLMAGQQRDPLGVALAAIPGAPSGRGARMSFEEILEKQRAVEGLRAAVRDAQTNRIFTGRSHQSAIESVPMNDDAYGRVSWAWSEETPDVGFVTREGEFITRDEAERRMGVTTMEDARDFLRERYNEKKRWGR